MAIADNRTSEFLRNLPFFSGLSQADTMAFVDAATVRRHDKGSDLFHQGDAAGHFFVILSGWVKLYRTTPEGEEALVGLFTRGDVFGEAALLSGGIYPLSAQAAEESKVIAIPAAMLKARAQKNPDIILRLMASLAREIQNLQRQNEQMAIMSAPQRVACLLLQLSSYMIGEGGTMTFPYDKSLAAAQLGMKPETFSRAIAQLKLYGVTSKGPEITIDSFSRLASFSCGHCTALPGECKGCRSAPTCGLQQAARAQGARRESA